MAKTITVEEAATKGILLIAIGSFEYLAMAENLAMSIKNVEPDMPIALAHNYNEVKSTLFDKLIKVPKKAYTTKGVTEYIKVKTYMYDLSPYDKTLFLDVDMVWLFKKTPSQLIAEAGDSNWTMSNTGKATYTIWANIEDIKELYPEKEMWNYHSECVYFVKNETTKLYFDKVKEMFDNPKVKGREFGGARIADELAFQLASIEVDQYPHKENWLPIFWYARDRKDMSLMPYKLAEKYFAYSVGGNQTPTTVKKNFTDISKYHSDKSKLGKAYNIRDKRLFIKERNKI